MTEEIERLGWNEALHPRQAGRFAPKGTASGTKPAAAPAGGRAAGRAGHGGGGSEGLSYNGRTGAGYGKKGGDHRVSALQSELNRLGFADGSGKALKKDGKLGPRTTAAIKKAQKALGMKADGIATPRLLAKLKASKGAHTHPSKAPKKSVPMRAARKHAAPARRVAAPHAAKRPTFAKQANAPAAPRKAAPVRRDVSRGSFISYSKRMTDMTRHLPGQHNQHAHANRLGKPSNIPGKTGLAKIAGELESAPDQGPALPAKARDLSSYSARRDAVKEHAKLSRSEFDALPADQKTKILDELKQAADAPDQHSRSDNMGIKVRGKAAHVTDAKFQIWKFTHVSDPLPDNSVSGRTSRLTAATDLASARRALEGAKKAELEQISRDLKLGYSSGWKLDKFKDEVAKRVLAKRAST